MLSMFSREDILDIRAFGDMEETLKRREGKNISQLDISNVRNVQLVYIPQKQDCVERKTMKSTHM